MNIFIKLSKHNLGFTYLETLLSVFLSASILTSIAVITKLEFSDYYLAKEFFHKIYITSKTNAILRKIIKDIDAHNFNILPKIHLNNISYSSGVLSNISKRTDELKNDTKSNAISYFKLNMENLLKTTHFQNNTFYICPYFKKSVSLNDIRTFLALTSDDYFEVSLNVTKDNKCYIAKIIDSKSILFNEAPKNIKFISFIPIESTYTIYLAKNKTLRFVTHKNNQEVENQPILQNVESINFLESVKDNFYTLSCKVKAYKKDKKEILLSLDNLLQRTLPFNFSYFLSKDKK